MVVLLRLYKEWIRIWILAAGAGKETELDEFRGVTG